MAVPTALVTEVLKATLSMLLHFTLRLKAAILGDLKLQHDN